jgi:hypothetical protein
VGTITAYLFHQGGHEDPATLQANSGQSFIGCYLLGMGFTFDDTDKKGVASPLSRMQDLIAENPKNAERIFPYIGGEEVNDSPTHAHHRFVINFDDFPLRKQGLSPGWQKADEKERREYLRGGMVPLDYSEPVAAEWPDLLAIIEAKVKPERDRDNRETRRRFWWKYGERSPAMFSAMAKCDFAFVLSRVSIHLAIAQLDGHCVPAESIVVFPSDTFLSFGVLQSRVHEVWARMMASTLEDRLRYTPTDCFETFPLPTFSSVTAELEALGEGYYRFRADLMVARNQGLTSVYNDFHDQRKQDAETWVLRRRHDEMDRAVLAAYGWNDDVPECQFFEENPSEEDEEEPDAPKKKKYRYRWPDDFRDEILARLLLLNRERAEEEAEAKRKREPLADPPLFSRRKPSKDSKVQMSLL